MVEEGAPFGSPRHRRRALARLGGGTRRLTDRGFASAAGSASVGDAPPPVEHEHGFYRIHSSYRVEYDVTEFERHYETATRRAVTADEQEHALEQAVALYGGPFLEGHDEEWARGRQRTLEYAWFDAVIAWRVARPARHPGGGGTTLRVGAGTRSLPRTKPAGTAPALAADGRRDEALRQYQAFCEGLRKAVNAAPGEELAALGASLLRWGAMRTGCGGALCDAGSIREHGPVLGSECGLTPAS